MQSRRFQSQISIDSCRGHSLLGITPTATRPRQDRDRPRQAAYGGMTSQQYGGAQCPESGAGQQQNC